MDFLDALEAQISNVMSRFVVNLIMHEKRHSPKMTKDYSRWIFTHLFPPFLSHGHEEWVQKSAVGISGCLRCSRAPV